MLSATWYQFDLDRGVWVKPAGYVKQAREHRAPLAQAAVDLLRAMRAASASDFLFPGRIPAKPLTDIKKAWASICRRAGLIDLRMHDLRHSFASFLVSSGHTLPTVGALLGHTQAQTTQRYAHLLDDPLRTAVNNVGQLV